MTHKIFTGPVSDWDVPDKFLRRNNGLRGSKRVNIPGHSKTVFAGVRSPEQTDALVAAVEDPEQRHYRIAEPLVRIVQAMLGRAMETECGAHFGYEEQRPTLPAIGQFP